MTESIIQGELANGVPHNQANSYSAYEPFNPLYQSVWPKLINAYSVPDARMIYFVFLAHVTHCNELGMHFAGVDAIANFACYSDTTVLRCEKILADDLEWLKMHWIKDPTSTRRALPRYQINPKVLWISHEFIQSAEDWWCQAVPFKRASLRRNVIIQGQPESESRIRIQNQNQTQIQTQEPPQSFEGEKQTRKRPQAANYPGEVNIESCKAPMPDQKSETLAQAIAAKYKTHVPQARQIIESYGAAAVTQEIDSMLIEAQNGTMIHKPMGYLRDKLRKRVALAMVGQENRALVKEVFKESFNR